MSDAIKCNHPEFCKGCADALAAQRQRIAELEREEKEIERLKDALMLAIKNKENAENGAWTAQEVYRRAIRETLPSGMREMVEEAVIRNAGARPSFSPNPAADRLRAENARLREALQEIYTRHLAKAAAGQLTVCERTTRERAHAALDAHEARRKK